MNNITDPEDGLPPIENWSELSELSTWNLPEIVEGVFRKSEIFVIYGGSRYAETSVLMDLALSVASGKEWLGIPTRKGRVLYLNADLSKPALLRRMTQIQNAKNIIKRTDALEVMHLRGYIESLEMMLYDLKSLSRDRDYSIFIIDLADHILKINNVTETDSILQCAYRFAQETESAIVFTSKELNRIADTTLALHWENENMYSGKLYSSSFPTKEFDLEWREHLLHRLT